MPAENAVIKTLMQRHGRTYAEELGIPVEDNAPPSLFRLLCAALLYSARIRAATATKAARAIADQGWISADKMLAATWEERVRVLDAAGYVRYDERTSTMLGQTAQLLIEKYQGDLRNLREAAEHIPEQEKRLLKQFKGIGDVGVSIFFREIQLVWDELFPFADARALEGARRLGIEPDSQVLAGFVQKRDFPRLVAALVRTVLARDHAKILEEAAGSNHKGTS